MSRKDADGPWGNVESPLAVLDERVLSLVRRLDKMDEERTWLVRLVLGVVVAAVLGIVINKGGLQ